MPFLPRVDGASSPYRRNWDRLSAPRRGCGCGEALRREEDRVKIEAGNDRSPYRFSPDEARAFLASWYRVVGSDGETIAYTPDALTAEAVVNALSGKRMFP